MASRLAGALALPRAVPLEGTRLRWAPYAAITAAAIVAFAPGLTAGFVSDDFNYISWITSVSFTGALHQFVPVAHFWYRPLNDVIFWLEYHAFGAQPLGYHVLSLACHIGIALLLYRFVTGLGVRAEAALAGVAAFVLSIHAHELVFWWAAAHYAFGGLAIVGALLAYAEGWTWVSVALAVAALASDEAGITLLPVLVTYEVLFRPDRTLRSRLASLAPVGVAEVAYAGLRIAGGGFWSESQPCRTPACLGQGMVEYFDQLFVRPGRLIEPLRFNLTDNRLWYLVAIVAGLAVVAALCGVWRWRDWRVIGFGAVWMLISTAVLVYGLYPYVSDRFLYYPELGLAVVLGGAIHQVLTHWDTASRRLRWGAGAVLAGYAVWLAIALPTIWHRAAQWRAAGQTVAAIFDRTQQLQPDPAPYTVLRFWDVPDSLEPDIPPGNTGPYLLRNGLTTGLRLRYGRADVIPIPASAPLPPGVTTVVCLDIRGGDVVPMPCPT